MSGTPSIMTEADRIVRVLEGEGIKLSFLGAGVHSTDPHGRSASPGRLDVRRTAETLHVILEWGSSLGLFGKIEARFSPLEARQSMADIGWSVHVEPGLWATGEGRRWGALVQLARALGRGDSMPCGQWILLTALTLPAALTALARTHLHIIKMAQEQLEGP